MPRFSIHIAPGDDTTADCPSSDAVRASQPTTSVLFHRNAVQLAPPSHSHIITSSHPMTWLQFLEAAAGFVYVVGTIAASVAYLKVLSPSLANELTWPNFNSSTHLFLGDYCNFHLGLGATAQVHLVAPSSGVLRQLVDKPSTGIAMNAVYARMLVLQSSSDFEDVIRGLHANDLNLDLPTQYCWADFDKQFEIAHTAARQARCLSSYYDNAAVHYEAVLRNIPWAKWQITYGGPNGSFTRTIAMGVMELRGGSAWLETVPDAFLDVVSEAAFWRAKGMKRWQLRWHNGWSPGVKETIDVVDAYGYPTTLIVKSMAYTPQSTKAASTVLQNVITSDMPFARFRNYTLVRESSRRVPDSLVLSNCGLQPTVLSQLWEARIGPYGAIDAVWVPTPPSLAKLVHDFTEDVIARLAQNKAALAAVQQLGRDTVTPTPRAWSGYAFSGGSPMCGNVHTTAAVQESFGFDDLCVSSSPLLVELDAVSVLFALSAVAHVRTTNIWPASARFVSQVQTTLEGILRLNVSAHMVQDVMACNVANVSMFQFGFQSGVASFLTQPLVDPTDDVWSVYGWVMLYDWALQRREALRFDGDVASITLMSKRYNSEPFIPTSLDASLQPVLLSQFYATYVTVVLACVASIMVVFGWTTRCRVLGRNLFRFNRVVGSVWVGRLFQCKRGFTAIILLSSSAISLQSEMGLSHFVSDPLSSLELLLVAGEATWLMYTLQDVVAAWLREPSSVAAPVSTALAWAAIVVYQSVASTEPVLALQRTCQTLVIGTHVECRSGQLVFGNSDRVSVLLGIQIGSVLVVYIVATLLHKKRETPSATLLLSGGADAFLDKTIDSRTDSFCLDRVTCIMAGLVAVEFKSCHFVFDVKSWSVFREPVDKSLGQQRRSVQRHARSFLAPTVAHMSGAAIDGAASFRPFDRVLAVGGLLYMLMSVAGSVLFIATSAADTTNDFWWSYFNATGGYGYLGNWYSTQLMLHSSPFNTSLADLRYADATVYNTSRTVISSSGLYASLVQFEDGSSLAVAIAGLKRMSFCDVPRIMTPYCWLDFRQQYAMASTAKRQRRCGLGYATNGAVYLEAALRNVAWGAAPACWSLTTVLGSDVLATADGVEWVRTVQSARTTVSDEERYWNSFGVSHYTTQFQNYKILGLFESFRIRNALGIEYSLPLKYGNASLQLGAQTSMKLYWSFAMDLDLAQRIALSTGASPTLLRSSPSYVYTNITLHDVLIQSGDLKAPFGSVYAALSAALGPFGSIDARHVPAPTTLRQFYSVASTTISWMVATNDNAQVAFDNLAVPIQWVPCPTAWLGVPRFSGSILCQDLAATSDEAMLSFWTHAGCSSAPEMIRPTALTSLVAAIMSNTTSMTCPSETRSPGRCTLFLDQAAQWTAAFLSRHNVSTLAAFAHVAQRDVSALNVSLLQFRRDDGAAMLHGLFSPRATPFSFFAWGFAIEWVLGHRDVVSFEGDEGLLVLLSSSALPVQSLPNPIAIRYLISTYTRNIVVYITVIIAFVAALTSVYIIESGGRVEGRNVIELNRVAAVVWAGRPLLFVRSIVALCLLSTSQLHLEQFGPVGLVAAFELHRLEWYRVILTAGEATWFVLVVCDVLVLVTRQHTEVYTLQCNIIVWVAAVLLSVYSPVTDTAIVDRVCSSPVVDFALECDAGVVVIGSATRVWHLIALSLGSIVLCYSLQVVRQPKLVDTRHSVSLLLSCGATYVFALDQWRFKHGYCLDKASAVITGLVCVQYHHKFYILDIKLWRTFVVEIPPDLRVPEDHPMHDRVRYAFPLLRSVHSE